MTQAVSINYEDTTSIQNDFHKQDISFDINKLKEACKEVLKIKGFDTSLGIPHFAGIPLNQIPGDPDSIKGNKVRGVYWTNLTRQEKKLLETLVFKNTNTQSLLKNLNILISKKFLMY